MELQKRWLGHEGHKTVDDEEAPCKDGGKVLKQWSQKQEAEVEDEAEDDKDCLLKGKAEYSRIGESLRTTWPALRG